METSSGRGKPVRQSVFLLVCLLDVLSVCLSVKTIVINENILIGAPLLHIRWGVGGGWGSTKFFNKNIDPCV